MLFSLKIATLIQLAWLSSSQRNTPQEFRLTFNHAKEGGERAIPLMTYCDFPSQNPDPSGALPRDQHLVQLGLSTCLCPDLEKT